MGRSHTPGIIVSVLVTSDVVQNRFIGMDKDATPTLNGVVLGVVDVDTRSGEYAPVIINGTAIVESAGVLTSGSAVATDATGKAIAWTTGPVVGYVFPGDSSAGAGELVEIILK